MSNHFAGHHRRATPCMCNYKKAFASIRLVWAATRHTTILFHSPTHLNTSTHCRLKKVEVISDVIIPPFMSLAKQDHTASLSY